MLCAPSMIFQPEQNLFNTRDGSLSYINKLRGSSKRLESTTQCTTHSTRRWDSCRKKLDAKAFDEIVYLYLIRLFSLCVPKQVKLLNSISENFNDAMKTPMAKLEFSKQFETIVRGVEVTRVVFLVCEWRPAGYVRSID
jgi:hypothetical protein